MRNVLLRTAAVAVLLLAGRRCHAEPPNAVQNPSFEALKNGNPVAWNISDEVSSLTGEKTHTGTHSVKIDDRSPKLGSSISSGFIPVEGGANYTIGAWGYPVDGKGVGLYVRVFDKDKKAIPSGPATYHKCLSSRRKRWRETRFVMTTPPNCAFIRVWIHSYSNSIVTAYVDDVSVRKGALVKEAVAVQPKPFSKMNVTFHKGDHPFLLVTKDEIEQIKQKAKTCKWADRSLKSFLKRAEQEVKQTIELPDRGGGWYHHYACKKDGHRLKTISPTQHKCPKCGTVYTGEPYDSIPVMSRHNRYARLARDMGLAYHLTGERRYAEKAKEILLAYANRYNTYELHDVRGPSTRRNAAHVGPQTLDESCWIIPIAQGYDLIHSIGVLSDAEKTDIETNLLRSAAETIKRNDAGISNWQSWHNAGMGAVAFCLRDRDLAEHVINGKSGFLFQMANSVTDDGFWYEGSWGYHYYALSAHVHLSETAFRSGIDLYKNERYKSMFDAPMKFMAPNTILPAFHDAHLCSAIGPSRLYEVAFARWRDPNYAWVLGKRRRGGLEALIVGVPEIPTVGDPVLSSCNFPSAGWFVLRSGTSLDSMYLALDYGPHGGGHGHPDKLGFSFYALGDYVAHDPGCVAYAVPIHREWYKQTIAHNTIVVDETSQEECTGELEFFCAGASFRAGLASAGTAYEPVVMQRFAAMSNEYLLLVDDVTDTEEHLYDWAYHGVGELVDKLPLKPQDAPLGNEDGYQHVTAVRRGAVDGNWTAAWTSKDRCLKLTMLGAPGTEIITGLGWGPNKIGKVPMVIARRKTKATRYIALLEPYRKAPRISSVAALEVSSKDKAMGFEIRRADGADQIVFGTPGQEKTAPSIATDARLGVSGSGPKAFACLADGTSLKSGSWQISASRPTRLYVSRAKPGQYRLQCRGHGIVAAAIHGPLLKADLAKTGDVVAYRVDESLKRIAPVAIKSSNEQIDIMLEPGTDYELSFAGAESLQETREAERHAAEEAARLAKLPPIPKFPVKPFHRPDGAAAAAGQSVTIQAEDFCGEGGGKVQKTTKKIGSDGAAFLRWDKPGHYLEWLLPIPKDGEYTIAYRYCTEPKDVTRAILIDGRYPAQCCTCYPFPSTGGYSNETNDWKSLALTDRKTKKPLKVYLTAGEHRLRMYNYKGPLNLDSIRLSSQ